MNWPVEFSLTYLNVICPVSKRSFAIGRQPQFDLVVQTKSQHCWIKIAADSKLAKVKSTLRPKRLAHDVAASQSHSGNWLKAIPVGTNQKSS